MAVCVGSGVFVITGFGVGTDVLTGAQALSNKMPSRKNFLIFFLRLDLEHRACTGALYFGEEGFPGVGG